MNETSHGNKELLECVLLARQIQEGGILWQSGCTEIARRIIAGRVNPNDACSLLAEVSKSLASPKELAGFELIAHEQVGHEGLGITTDSCAADILQECRSLVSLNG